MSTKTTEAPEKGGNQRPGRQTLRVTVTYPPAVKPYKDDAAPPTETLATLKTAVLNAFHLEETATKKFKLFHGGTEYSNPSQTLGEIAGDHQEVVFQLEEVIVQG